MQIRLRLYALLGMRCMIYDIVVFDETSVFVRLHENDKPTFFKNLHSKKRFWKGAFSVTIFTGYVWTVYQTGERKSTLLKQQYLWMRP